MSNISQNQETADLKPYFCNDAFIWFIENEAYKQRDADKIAADGSFVYFQCLLYDTFSVNRGKGDYHIDYVPAPRITEADKKNDKKYEVYLLYLFSSSINLLEKPKYIVLLKSNDLDVYFKRCHSYSSPLFCLYLQSNDCLLTVILNLLLFLIGLYKSIYIFNFVAGTLPIKFHVVHYLVAFALQRW